MLTQLRPIEIELVNFDPLKSRAGAPESVVECVRVAHDNEIGAGGVERVIEVKMDADERKLFDASVEHVRTLVAQIKL